MADLIKLIFSLVLDLFRSWTALEAEVLVLRQQIIVLRRGRVGRLPFGRRLLGAGLGFPYFSELALQVEVSVCHA